MLVVLNTGETPIIITIYRVVSFFFKTQEVFLHILYEDFFVFYDIIVESKNNNLYTVYVIQTLFEKKHAINDNYEEKEAINSL